MSPHRWFSSHRHVDLLGVLAALACASSFAIGCGERVDVVVTAPGSPAGTIGTVLKGATARFYEDNKLFAWVNGDRVDVSATAMRRGLSDAECGTLPEKWRDRGAEAGRGKSACAEDDGCCGC